MHRWPSLVFAAVALAAPLSAQTSAITGTVRDEQGRALADVQLVVEPEGRQTTSDTAGRFRLTLPTGAEYQLVARRIDYVPTRQRVRLTVPELELSFVMRELPTELRTIISSASHVGLTGVVLDRDGNGSRVTLRIFSRRWYASTASDREIARGSHQETRTSQDGAFFAPVAPGVYVLLVERDGKTLGTVRVAVPMVGRRCVVVRLDLFDRHGQQRAEGCSAQDLDHAVHHQGL